MKIGIITFHNSYNCGSMLESYAIQTIVQKLGCEAEIVNFSSEGQKELYATRFKNDSIKNIIKNILTIPAINKIERNNQKYEEFKKKRFSLTKEYKNGSEISEEGYEAVIAGSDQIWNITIIDYDDAYFLPWVKEAKKIAYAPSFGAKKIPEHTDDKEKYCNYLKGFDCLSIRENNGQKWIKEMIGVDVPVLLDPTLLLEAKDYDKIEDTSLKERDKYIFFYSPSFDREICKFVKKIADKYNLKVVTWSTKSYYFKLIKSFGFVLPEYESPAVYLNLIKNAELVLTTSYHGTIFSTLYRKKFITIKNGEMYGNDDRVITLLKQLNMENRLIPYDFDDNFNYLGEVDYTEYEKNIDILKKKSMDYLRASLRNVK